MDDTNVTPDAAGIVERLNRLETFLKGEGALDDCWFGDTRPAGRGPFWWRSEVSAVANSVRLLFADKDATIAAQAAEIERLREALALAAQLPLMSEAAREHATPWGILTVEERLDRITRNAERHDAAVIAARNLTGAS